MLAFVLPAFIVAAQYAAFGRLALVDDGSFDFDSPSLPPIPSVAVGNRAISYHDPGHGDRITVHRSMDAYVNKRDGVIVQANTPVTVRAIVPYRVDRGIWYAYEVVGDGSAHLGGRPNLTTGGHLKPYQVATDQPIELATA
jgi:hypothetical protein